VGTLIPSRFEVIGEHFVDSLIAQNES